MVHTCYCRQAILLAQLGSVGVAAAVVVIEAGIEIREIDRLGVDELRTLDGAVGTEPRAREQQEGQCAGLALLVVLEVHEGGVDHIIAVIVVLVAADGEVRNFWLRQAAAIGDFLGRTWIADILGFAHHQRINQPRTEGQAADVASGLRHANGVVGEFCVAVDVHVATAPQATIAVLVAGQVLEVCLQHLALQILGIFQMQQGQGGQTEGVVFVDMPVNHEAVEVGMGHVAAELAQRRAARPGVQAGLRAQEGAIRVHRQGKPETDLIGTCCHVVDVTVVRVGDPVRGYRVVGGQQGMLAGKADTPKFLAVAINLAVCGQVVGHALHGGMTLDLDRQVLHELVTAFNTVFHEEAVADDVVGDVVLDAQVIGTVHGHAAVEGTMKRSGWMT